MKAMMFAMILASTAAAAQVPVPADELTDNDQICEMHVTNGNNAKPAFSPGWEHCAKIVAAWRARDEARRLEDETKNPELKKTRDFAKTLK